MGALLLISLNVEADQHYQRFLPFLKQEKPDVVCLQEVLERDMERLSRELNMQGAFEPMMSLTAPQLVARGLEGEKIGVALFTRFEAVYRHEYYFGSREIVPKERPDHQGVNLILLTAQFEYESVPFTFGTTHFTWTPDGDASDMQRENLADLFSTLERYPEIVFCGDFNAPRGREIWGMIARRYKDNIPPEYLSSVDPNLHRAKSLQVMVDGLFTTPGYTASSVRLAEGVSDHKAVVGYISSRS